MTTEFNLVDTGKMEVDHIELHSPIAIQALRWAPRTMDDRQGGR